MTEITPALAWEECHEIALHLDRVSVLGKPKAFRQAPDVCVNHNTGLDTKAISKYYIRCLACHTAQRQQSLHICWHFSSVLSYQRAHRFMDGARLVAPQSNGANEWRDFIS